jgi:hypothetical protein
MADRNPVSPSWYLTGILLVPLAAVPFSHQAGLVVACGAILLILGVMVGPTAVPLVKAVGLLPRPVRYGLACYGGAAIWGAAVGLASGNPVRYIISQSVAMLLLPLGTVAFLARPDMNGEALATGLARAAIFAASVHLVLIPLFAPSVIDPQAAGRFVLRYGTSFVGASVLALIVVAARLKVPYRRGWFAAGALAAVVLVAGGMSRGAWAGALIGVATLIALTARDRLRALAVVISALLALTAVFWCLVAWSDGRGRDVTLLDIDAVVGPSGAAGDVRAGLTGDGEKVLEIRDERTRGVEIALFRELPTDAAALEFRGFYRGGRQKLLVHWAQGLDADGEPHKRSYWFVPGRGRWVRYGWLMSVPRDASSLEAGIEAGPHQGGWLIRDLVVRRFDSRVAMTVRRLYWRSRNMFLFPGNTADGTVMYRLREWRSIRDAWLSSSWTKRLLGAGLGAQYAFVNTGWGEDGQRVLLARASYIHNFYAFLGFKLGLAGIVALIGLLVIVGWTFSRARRSWCEPGHGWFLAGAAAAWTAYLIWSVSSPEIYDFRLAPVWGAVIAASIIEVRREGDGAADQGRH